MQKLKILIDENIAQGKEAFQEFGDVLTINGRNITNKILTDFDVLIVRSITKVSEELLQGTKIKFVGTATIGIDHIDKEYLEKNRIAFSDAKGCNADSVTEYVFAAIYCILNLFNLKSTNLRLGVVGVGNIGSRVAKIANKLGFEVLKNDPPLELSTGSEEFVPLNEILNCDLVTLHVPLTLRGEHKTFHLFNNENLPKLKNNTMFINTSRGEVVDNTALLNTIKKKNLLTVLDVWEKEPKISHELLKEVVLSTPHIAGYSFEGKVEGTKLIYDSLCRSLKINPTWRPNYPSVINEEIRLENNIDSISHIYTAIKKVYDIESDSGNLKSALKLEIDDLGKYFDTLRKNYPLRREFFNYRITNINPSEEKIIKAFSSLRFKV